MWALMHAFATWSLVGLIWVVQLVIYPQFGAAGRAGFAAYHAGYTRRIAWIVGPLMLAEAATAGMMFWQGERAAWFLVSLGLLAINWLSTALVQVPLHGKLEQGFAEDAWRALVRTNWVRTVAWTARGGCVAFGLMRG